MIVRALRKAPEFVLLPLFTTGLLTCSDKEHKLLLHTKHFFPRITQYISVGKFLSTV